jgi:hypothetical protein
MVSTEQSYFKELKPGTWALPIVLLAVFVVMLPMLVQGIPDGFDLLQHMRFAAAYHDAIVRGDLIPAWAGNDNFGYGSIGIRYYPPLAYILLALGKIASGSWYVSFLANSFIWMLAGCVGVYLWAREWVDVPMAVFASGLYAIAPYHTFQIYQAVLFAEFAAAGILPFCFLYLTRVCRKPNRKDSLLLTVSTSLLLLTHIPSTIIGVIGLGVYAACSFDRSKLYLTLKHMIAAMVATICATAFHWVKLITETSWVRHNLPEYYSSGYYDFQRYFFPMYLISPPERYVQKLLWHLDTVIVLTVLFAAPVFLLMVTRLRKGRIEREAPASRVPLVTVFTAGILMLSVASSFIWNAVPLLAKLQFPWRWLLIATVVGPVLFVAPISCLSGGRFTRGVIYLTTLFVLALGLFSLTQNALLSSSLTEERFTAQIAGMYDLEGCSCWWPVWAKAEAFNITEKVSAASRKVSVEEWKAEARSVIIEPGAPTKVRLATFFHPYWSATVNGDVSKVMYDDTGAINIEVPSETARIELKFREPLFLTLTKVAAVLTWLMLTGIYLAEIVQNKIRIFLS